MLRHWAKMKAMRERCPFGWRRMVDLSRSLPLCMHHIFRVYARSFLPHLSDIVRCNDSARYIDHVYADEKKHGKALLPKDPFQRAAVEVMADWFGGCGWIRLHYATLKQCDGDKARALVTEWKGKWKILEQRLSQFTNEGLYLPDGRMSFFECIAYPFMERLCVIEAYAQLDIFGEWMNEFPRIKSWYEAMCATDAVQAVRQDPKYLIDGYARYRKMGEEAYAKQKAESTKAALKTSGVFVGGMAVGALSAAAYFGKLKQ